MAVAATTRPASSRTKRRRVPRAQRQEQMLKAATRLFARRGFHDVSMDEIAEASGITKPMLYAYFDSKEGLFLACFAKGEDRLREAVRLAVERAAGSEQRLWHGFVALFRFFDENPDLAAISYPLEAPFVEAAVRGRVAMADMLAELFVATAVSEGVDRDVARETEPLAYMLTGATLAMLRWCADRPDEPRDLHALRLMNFAWMGLGNLVRGELWIPPTEEAEK